MVGALQAMVEGAAECPWPQGRRLSARGREGMADRGRGRLLSAHSHRGAG